MRLWRKAIVSILLALCLPACSSQGEAEPKDAQGYLDRGNSYLQKGNWDRAIADFDRAIELNPNRGRSRPLHNLG